MPRAGDYRDRLQYQDQGFRDFMGRVKLRCFQLDLNQRELADAVGVNHATVSGWWSLKYMPKFDATLRLPKALKCDGHWLLTGEGSPEDRHLTEAEGQYQGASIVLEDMRAALDGITMHWNERARRYRPKKR